MVKVITYGTYDLLHYGHIKLLERAKALGDYLIVGVTADDFDKTRGKINVKQTLMERIEAVRATGLADEIIVEEYEGQKIDDIRRCGVDIFTVGSDWEGKFDYLNDYCKVVYLPRTEGISSSELRAHDRTIRLGVVGEFSNIKKFIGECSFVNGIEGIAVYTENSELIEHLQDSSIQVYLDYKSLLESVDAVYIASLPSCHYSQISDALDSGKNVLCETPIALKESECADLFEKAEKSGLILMEANKTAYSTAFDRLLLLIKSGKIGDVVSVDATCTSLDSHLDSEEYLTKQQSSMCAWGPVAMLPVFSILGTQFEDCIFTSLPSSIQSDFDLFTHILFRYKNAVANVKVGKGVKSEGELVVSGTKGYVYVPAPWWKTEYFEVRYENQDENKRYFYKLEGEGIRYELVTFLRAIESGENTPYLPRCVSQMNARVLERFYYGDNKKLLS